MLLRAIKFRLWTTSKCCEITTKRLFSGLKLAYFNRFSILGVWTNSKAFWSGMPLAFVRPLETGWGLQPARSANTLCMPLSSQWVHLLSSTWCWLFGEICASICGQPNVIPGIIYNQILAAIQLITIKG